MGQDKALLMLGGEPLVKRAMRKLGEICADVAIAGGADELRSFGRVISDKCLGCGPLGGIVSSLEQSSYEWNLFLSVDAPFVPVSAFKTMLAMTSGFEGVCVMPQAAGVKQPLCAVYSRRAVAVLQQELADGRWKVTQAIASAGEVKIVEFEDAGWFANLNTPEEFAAAERNLNMS
jgi:molybdopterin-guanine dinucleotide biosynthesis protein A